MPETHKSKSIGLKMVRIDAGDFHMGSPATETARRADESRHRVRINKPFWLGVHEVTQEEFQQVMKSNPSWFAPKGEGKAKVGGLTTDQFPVERVTWYEAIEFCNALSKRDGFAPYYKLAAVKREEGALTSATVTMAGGNGYRLPTEAEWEYACRAGTTTAFHLGPEVKRGEANLKPILVPGGYGSYYKWPDLGRTARVTSTATHPRTIPRDQTEALIASCGAAPGL
jgi:formylglycine-generating enzyme required for sulfatase activity